MKSKALFIFEAPLSPYWTKFFEQLSMKVEIKVIIYGSETLDQSQYTFAHTYCRSTYIKLKRKNSQYLDRKIYLPFQIIKRIIKEKPNIIFTSGMSTASVSSVIYKLVSKIPVILLGEGTIHTEEYTTKLQQVLRRLFSMMADYFIVTSQLSKNYYLSIGVSIESIAVIPYSSTNINYKRDFDFSKNGTKRLIYIGQLIKRKGVDLLLHAFYSLIKIDSNYELQIYGDGPEKENLILLCERLGIHEKVSFKGYLDHDIIFERMADCHIFIFPSLEDTFAVTIPEALSSGLPVISNLKVGAAHEFIQNGVNGFIVDFRYSEQVVNNILYCISNIEEMSQNARKIINYCNLDVNCHKYIEIMNRKNRYEKK